MTKKSLRAFTLKRYICGMGAKYINEPFSKNLNRFMKQLGLGVDQFAAHCGVKTATMSTWIYGRNRATMSLLRRVAGRLGVSVDELLSDEPRASLRAVEPPGMALQVLDRDLPAALVRDAEDVLRAMETAYKTGVPGSFQIADGSRGWLSAPLRMLIEDGLDRWRGDAEPRPRIVRRRRRSGTP